ncbi:MAG: thermonuclease family protein [Rhizobacter sp.]|nr:thermonuclease family protein [Ferruginibacter sp.]
MKSFLLLTFLATAFTGFCQQNCLLNMVTDGDSYRAFINGKEQKVQLLHVDAPEIGQYFGKESKDAVTALMEGRMVELTLHDFDLYNRLVVSIRVNGMSLDSLLIANGWAVYDYKFSGNKQLAGYEAEAKIKGAGLWQCASTIPPWIWRQLNKRDKRHYQKCRSLPGPTVKRA